MVLGALVVVKRILRYLKGTLGLGLHLSPNSTHKTPSLIVFYDDDWAFDHDDEGRY